MDSELFKKTYPYQKLIVENIKFVSRALKYATRDMINFAKEAYEWLGLEQARNPKATVIKKAYYDRSKILHPDKGGDEKVFTDIVNAYDAIMKYHGWNR